MNVQYPHEPEVTKVTLFGDDHTSKSVGNMLASVILSYGPITIRASLVKGKDGPFLSLPSRKGTDDKYWDMVYFHDKSLYQMFQEKALAKYNEELKGNKE